uniref:Putative 52 kDa repressor of the inhibitor of the protein n=1 Tax=Rhipicephalus pulchellus TaxID=72859 RepID=L7LXZ9_RHIPC
MRILCESCHSDVGDSVSSAVGELRLWYRKLERLEKRRMGPLEAPESCPAGIFPVIRKLLQIMATLPVTTSTSERSFSTLRRLKTYLRNTTGALRLNGLALLNIHREVPLSPEEILDELATKPRRLDFKL